MADTAKLPDDIEQLKALFLAQNAELAAAKAGLLAKTLKVQIARLKRLSFGASSERVSRELEQLELKLEEIETAEAQAEAAAEPAAALSPPSLRKKKHRRRSRGASCRRRCCGGRSSTSLPAPARTAAAPW